MGKYACKRWRFHHSAVKCGDTNETKNEEPKESVEPLKKGKNIFAKLNMEEFRIATKADVPENAGSYKLQNATKTPPQKTKKEKFREKKEYWKNQINSICSQRLKSKERERMKNTPIVGDMTDILESLPTVSAQRETRKQKPVPYKAPVKLKSRQKEMMENIGLFKQVLNHPMFQRNPSSAIKEHLQNKVEYMNSLSEVGLCYVKKLMQFIEEKGIRHEGIYRICGIQSEINQVLNLISCNNSARIPEGITLHSVTAALKAYFRNLSEPLLTLELYWPLVNIAKQKNTERLYSCINSLPSINVCFLYTVMEHLNCISKCSENKMSVYSLAVCWSPVIIWHHQLSMDGAMLLPWVIQTLIDNYHQIS